jgi:hypothetical protein
VAAFLAEVLDLVVVPVLEEVVGLEEEVVRVVGLAEGSVMVEGSAVGLEEEKVEV